ncbi:MAG: hypothetical protein ACR2QK_00695 [Acidimicrobiales bacterium]
MGTLVRSAPSQPRGQSALVIYRPLVEKVVAALGALVTHQLAYLAASVAGLSNAVSADHGHLSLQWAIVAPLAVGGAAALIVWQLRSLGFRSVIPARQLGALVVGFFIVQELIEGLAGGHSIAELMTHPAIAIGVAIGPVIGWLLSRVLAGVTELAARLLARPDFQAPAVRTKLTPIPIPYRSNGTASPSRPRAPPSPLRI